jgi:hypothetical protein
LLILLSVLVGGIAHWLTRRYFLACAISAVIVPLLLLLVTGVQASPDLAPRIWAAFALMSFIISMIVGAPLLLLRRRAANAASK